MINPIDGAGSARGPSSIRRATKTGKAKSADFSKHLGESEETDSISPSSAASPLGVVSGVFGVQEVDDALARAAKGKLRANDILDKLEDLRLEILSGTLSPAKLRRLADVVSRRRADVTDPKLAEILDEIDLRAQVELAKFSSY